MRACASPPSKQVVALVDPGIDEASIVGEVVVGAAAAGDAKLDVVVCPAVANGGEEKSMIHLVRVRVRVGVGVRVGGEGRG